jgi:hypothetical protein
LAEIKASLDSEQTEIAPERVSLMHRLDHLIDETGSFLGNRPVPK